MKHRDLYDLAAADTLGLLDDEERAEFESAYRSAPPNVQADLRRLQLRTTSMERLLPNVEPSPSLRSRVLEAVRRAMDESVAEPLAKIGPLAMPSRRAIAVWRAAAIGLATSALVLGGFVYQMSVENQTIAQAALTGDIADDLKVFGPGFRDVVMSPNMQRVSFAQPAPDAVRRPVNAQLFIDPESGTAILAAEGLPISAGQYTLVIENGASGDRTEQRFKATGGLVGVRVERFTFDESTKLSIHEPRSVDGSAKTLLIAGGDA